MFLTVLLPYHQASRNVSVMEERAHIAGCREKGLQREDVEGDRCPRVPVQVTGSCCGRAATAPQFSLRPNVLCSGSSCSHHLLMAQPPPAASAPGATAGPHVALRWAGLGNRFGWKVTSRAILQIQWGQSGTREDVSLAPSDSCIWSQLL